MKSFALVFDTANETIAVGLGELCDDTREIRVVASREEKTMRASNTRLLPIIDELIESVGVSRNNIAYIGVGLGPGSFTGVRIAMATAKGIASALGVSLIGLSTPASIAQGARAVGIRGTLLVAADAMRKEIYPAYFDLNVDGVLRLTPDVVVKASEFSFATDDNPDKYVYVTGDALRKYRGVLTEKASYEGAYIEVLDESIWEPTGAGLLAELQAKWQSGCEILDVRANSPMSVLPVYTRLSDAEENERAKLALTEERNLKTGVQGTANEELFDQVQIAPFDANFAEDAAAFEAQVMGSDAWSKEMLLDDLSASSRTWWMATREGKLLGYAGAMLAGDDMQILKIATAPEVRRQGIARELLVRIAEDARNLAAQTLSLEVRVSNEGAIGFYRALGFEDVGMRPRYYSDGDDAQIMSQDVKHFIVATAEVGACSNSPELARTCQRACSARAELRALPTSSVAMPKFGDETTYSGDAYTSFVASLKSGARPHTSGDGLESARPLILAIESSCDETAASVIDGEDNILSDIISSQVDFHARFGGVVPEIASRKHTEAIAGVAKAALDDAALSWQDLDAIAVTYAPGLVGALVVGVAFAKGAAWALNVPVIGVNHLEGHLYANKLDPNFAPPAVVSLVSGGNTMLVYMRDWQDYKILGGTIDDAVGEAFDKVAKLLGLPYPGGPHISRLAKKGNPHAIDFPRALLHSKDYRFSLSGLKTAVSVYVQQQLDAGADLNLPDICASFQQAVIDVQVAKARSALRETGARCFALGGGVAANPALREAYEQMCAEEGVTLTMPSLSICGDNAVMIGLVAQDRFKQKKFMSLDGDAFAHADLSEPY